MATLKLIYRNGFTEELTIVEKTISDHAGFDAVYDALKDMCMSLGYTPETVEQYFNPDEGSEADWDIDKQ